MAAPVVLVHGAWHGAWCWERVIPLLEAQGIRATALNLPTCEPAPATATLADDAATLAAALDALDAPAVVVGHSYGGMVITEGAAGHQRARHLVYVAALMPDSGESTLTLAAATPNPDLIAAIEEQPGGRTSIKPETIGPLFYNDCDDATVAWATRHARSMCNTMGDAATRAAWRGIPSTYVICTGDRTILPELQRGMAARATATIEFATSHSPFASQPALLAGAIAGIARA